MSPSTALAGGGTRRPRCDPRLRGLALVPAMAGGFLALQAIMGCAGAKTPVVAAPEPVQAGGRAAFALGPAARVAPPSSPFMEGVAQIQEVVPRWDNGTGVAIQYLKVATGKKVTFVYVDETPPEWKETLGTWLILSRAKMDDAIVSTVAIALRELRAGHFEGPSAANDCMIGATIGTEDWKPTAASTAWSNNDGGYCEVDLRPGAKSGDFEGHFTAKLVAQDGTFFTVDEGYLYINR